MSVKITVDSTGFDDFYGFFNTERTLSKDDVDKLFDKQSYQKMVEPFGADVKFTEKAEFGKEVGFYQKEPWVEFREGFSHLLDLKAIASSDCVLLAMTDRGG